MNISLRDYGLVPVFLQQLSADEIEQGRVARVIQVQRSQLAVFDGSAERVIPLGSSWHNTAPSDRPTIGDWVVLTHNLSNIERVLERKSVFRRIAVGDKNEYQLIAANIDILFLVTSCNEEFKESRLERYLAQAVEAGVVPVVVLTKIDQTEDSNSFVKRVRTVHPGLPVESVNALDASTFTGLMGWIEKGSTVALVGSSGVGKSTLLNSLADRTIADTGTIREDDKKGRHTTSHRALFRLPEGGLVIDVPGIRELGVVEIDEALATVFDDIESMASQCRFKNCRHGSEPGCAVHDAINSGDLDERRLRNYRKLLRENKRNSASVAEKRSQGRAFAKHVKQVKTLKQDKTTGS